MAIDTWLRMLANELERKGFPLAYGPHLRHAAEVLANVEPQLLEIDAANAQLTQQLAAKEKELVELQRDAKILWARYQKAIDLIRPHNAEVAAAMAEYKPRFYEIL